MIQRWDLRECFIFLSLFIYTPWPSLQGFLLKIDGAARLPNTMIYISLALVLYFYSANLKKFLLPLSLWGIWTTYTVINSAFQGDMVTGKWTVPFFAFLLYGKWAYFTVLLAMLQYKRLFVLKLAAWSLLASCLLYLCFGQTELLYGTDFERLFSDVVNANEIAFSGVVLTAICIYLLLLPKPNLLLGIAGTLLSAILIANTASRTAFVSVVPLFFIGGWVFLRKRLSLAGSLLAGLLLMAVVAVPTWHHIEEKTVVGQRLQYREREAENLKLQEGIVTDLLGERAIYYYEGLEIWERSPIFGVGYGNYAVYSSSGLRNHIEYMAQLCEGGVVGAFIYLLFLLTLISSLTAGLFIQNKSLVAEKNVAVGILIALLMFNIGLFTAMHNDFYILCALVLIISPSRSAEKLKQSTESEMQDSSSAADLVQVQYKSML